jgi:hypothetical protein
MGHWQATQSPWLDLYDKGPATTEQRGLAEDKRRLREMAQQRRDQQQQFDQAFEEWKAERQLRAERLFAKLSEDQGFPPPSALIRRLRP